MTDFEVYCQAVPLLKQPRNVTDCLQLLHLTGQLRKMEQVSGSLASSFAATCTRRLTPTHSNFTSSDPTPPHSMRGLTRQRRPDKLHHTHAHPPLTPPQISPPTAHPLKLKAMPQIAHRKPKKLENGNMKNTNIFFEIPRSISGSSSFWII